jgi:hypothetical protein
MLPATEPHGSCNRAPRFLHKSVMVPATEPHGSCNRAPRFLHKSVMVPATETYGSCKRSHGSRYRDPRFLQQYPMAPATEPHSSCHRTPWYSYLLQSPLIPAAKPMVLAIEPAVLTSKALFSATKPPVSLPHGFCRSNTEPLGSYWYRALCFLLQRPMVPATEMHGSSYQNPMIPTANSMVPATEPHWFLLKIPPGSWPLDPCCKAHGSRYSTRGSYKQSLIFCNKDPCIIALRFLPF